MITPGAVIESTWSSSTLYASSTATGLSFTALTVIVHGGDVRVIPRVVRFVGECVDALEVGVRRVGEQAVGAQGQCAVGDIADQDGGERVALRIRVIGSEHLSVDYQCHILIGTVPIIIGHGRHIYALDRDRDNHRVRIRECRRTPDS